MCMCRFITWAMRSFPPNLRTYLPLFFRLFFVLWSVFCLRVFLRSSHIILIFINALSYSTRPSWSRIVFVPLLLGSESDWCCKGRFYDAVEYIVGSMMQMNILVLACHYSWVQRHWHGMCVCVCSCRCLAVTKNGIRDHWLAGSSRAMLWYRSICVYKCIVMWYVLILARMRIWGSGNRLVNCRPLFWIIKRVACLFAV